MQTIDEEKARCVDIWHGIKKAIAYGVDLLEHFKNQVPMCHITRGHDVEAV